MINPARSMKTVAGLATVLLLAAMPVAHAEEATPGPLALQGVMKQLGIDMQAVTGAVAIEDWATVATLAPQIARHAEPPPEEKARIIGWLGSEAPRFRGFDHAVHEAADAMGEAAARSDGEAVIRAFSAVQQGCLACHQNFRQPFITHFYGQPE